MEDLIKVDYSGGKPAVSARELHEFLEVGARFNDWFPRMCEYGFSEGEDYCSFLSNRSDGLPGKPRQDAAITIDMAKELGWHDKYLSQVLNSEHPPKDAQQKVTEALDRLIHQRLSDAATTV